MSSDLINQPVHPAQCTKLKTCVPFEKLEGWPMKFQTQNVQSDNDIITFIGSLRSHAGLQVSNLQTWFTLFRGHSLTTLIGF